MIFELFVIILIARYLRKSMQTSVSLPQWDKILVGTTSLSIILFVAQFISPVFKIAVQILTELILISLAYIIYKSEQFKQARFMAVAIIPYIVIYAFSSLLQLISKSLYESWSHVLNTAISFAVIWGIGCWWIAARQNKELEKAQIKAKKEEENTRAVTAMKDELEVKVKERTAELTKQKEELETTLTELKSAQKQLIQSEKMASMGELTAGIAHEIQNPLNFVNNFSEVSVELIDEMKEDIQKGTLDDAKQIADDLSQNLQKIIFHGKRADAIVKGMLQHSRGSSGQKELTDINALADEYLRLSYHGLRAKDKSFNATMKTDFDENTGRINIVPQDIGRVLLNLFNNAFYAVSEKKKCNEDHYDPILWVSTKRITDDITPSGGTRGAGNFVEIRVRDNGSGIPQKVVDKIFQPFFTTKPTGQGTGLGLSLSYDIIKAHGGEITVNTKEGEGTEFTVRLPA